MLRQKIQFETNEGISGPTKAIYVFQKLKKNLWLV